MTAIDSKIVVIGGWDRFDEALSEVEVIDLSKADSKCTPEIRNFPFEVNLNHLIILT